MPAGIPFDEQQQEIFCSFVKEGHNPRTAAQLCDFSWETVKRRMESDIAFAEAVADATSHATAKIEDVLYQEAAAGNLGAIKEWLHNRAPDRWRQEQVLRKEITGAGGGPITVVQGVVAAFREVLTDDDTREGALALAAAIPAAGHEIAAGEDGDAGAPGADSDG